MAEAIIKRQGGRVMRSAALALFVLVAGCAVVPKGPPRTVDVPPVVTTPDSVTPALPTDTERNRVAVLVPLTGAYAGVGTSIANAANMAVLDTGGARIRVTIYDTAQGAAAAAQKALAEGNKLILGPLLADDVRAVAPLARAVRVPVIAFSNDISVAGNGAYIMGSTPAQSVDRVVGYARSRGLSKFAGLIPVGIYGQRASSTFLRSVEAGGGQVVGMQNFDRTAGSLAAAVKRLNQTSSYDAILIADSGRTAIQAVPVIRANGGASAKILGTELWNTEGALAASPALRGAWFASVSDGMYNKLAVKYRERFGKSPYRLASLGYDAVLLVTRIAGDWRTGSAFPSARLMDPGGFDGVDGAFRFSRDGVVERTLEVQQAGPSGSTIVSAAPRGFGN